MKRQAFMTGTYDPYHKAYVWQLQRAYAVRPFDEAVVAPIMHNVNKPNAAAWEHRVALAQITLGTLSLPFSVRVAPIANLDAETIRAFAKEHLEDPNPLRIAGADSIIEFAEDKKHWPILADFEYIVVMRPAVSEAEVAAAIELLPKDVAARLDYTVVPVPPEVQINDVSARNLRGDITGNASLFVPEAMEYMARHQLYQ